MTATERVLDGLGGCVDRDGLLAELAGAVGTSARPPVLLLLVDLDGFRGVRETAGPSEAAAVLSAVASGLVAALGAGPLLARLGGAEFAVLAPAVSARAAEDLAERVRAAVAAAGAPWGVTGSVGGAVVRPGETVPQVLRRADDVVCRARSLGGNRAAPLPY